MDVATPEQARIAEEAGACAVMALERIPADIRAAGGVPAHERPQDDQGHPGGRLHPCYGQVPHRPHCRGAQVLQAIEIDYIDESEVLSRR